MYQLQLWIHLISINLINSHTSSFWIYVVFALLHFKPGNEYLEKEKNSKEYYIAHTYYSAAIVIASFTASANSPVHILFNKVPKRYTVQKFIHIHVELIYFAWVMTREWEVKKGRRRVEFVKPIKAKQAQTIS